MKKLLFLVLVSIVPIYAGAQSLSVDIEKGSNNNLSTYYLKNASIEISSAKIVFKETGNKFTGLASYGFSNDLSLVGILSDDSGTGKATILSDAGTALGEYKVSGFTSTDPSLLIYPLNNGGALLRSNIVSFVLYNPFGKAGITISGGGQSSGGQVISEAAISTEGNTIIIYTPQIKNGSSRGSRAGRITENGQLSSIYSSGDRTITDLQVSADGQFVMVITGKQGVDDQVLILDKYGNQINSMESSENLKSTSLSQNAEYLTVYSGGRAAVYNTVSGERLGSTSFGSNLILAQYFPDDEILLGLSGDVSQNGEVASNLEFHAIHFGKRQVERKAFNRPLGLSPLLKNHFVRIGPGLYQLKGTNKIVEITAQF